MPWPKRGAASGALGPQGLAYHQRAAPWGDPPHPGDPYLREDRRGRRGRRRGKRGARGTGCYPVLECLGIADRGSPASRSEIALHMVQAASYLEAAHMLSRRGLSCDVSSLVRITTAPAEASTRLRDAAREAALRLPVPSNGPLAGKRVRVSLDGGRVRTRRTAPRPQDGPRAATAFRHPGGSHACW